MTGKKILILSPHTDDAELGCGGSISKFIEGGNEILWVVFSSCEESLPKGLSRDTLRKEFIKVTKSLGLGKDNYKIFGYNVRHLTEKRQHVLERLIKIRDDFQPTLVLTPSLNDYHQDHHVVTHETIRAFKTNASIIGYELPWNHITFDTNLFVRLEKRHIEKKYDLLKNYESQLTKGRNYFSKEYIFGLANVRGTQCNSSFAEAFEVIRWMM